MKYDYKDGQLKSKYERKINELETELNPKLILELEAEVKEEIKELRDYRNYKLKRFKKFITLFAILADLVLLAGVALFVVGYFLNVKDSSGTLLIVFGAILIFCSAVFFGLAEYNREQKRKFLKEFITDSELITTKEEVMDFVDNHTN